VITNAGGKVVTLRRAAAADLSWIGGIERSAFGDPWSERSFSEMLDHPAAIFLVATDDISGVACGYSITIAVADEAEILNLAVAEARRGQGIGGLLLDAALDEAVGRGAETVFLEVRESNQAARALYHSRGFTERFRRTGYYRNPVEDALVLSRAIER
jgi:[ribosomal protein S18]-alanine N-acetyltransferase